MTENTMASEADNPMGLATDIPAYFQRTGAHTWMPTLHAQGAWQAHEQHMSPVGGLLVHAIEAHDPREELQLARITFDILGQIPAEETTVEVETIRPGRTIELVEARLSVGGRTVVRASAWRLLRGDSSPVEGTPTPVMPGPDDFGDWEGSSVWPGGYIRSLDLRRDPASAPGQGRLWLHSPLALVHGEESSPTARFCMLVDTANGVAPRVSPTQWMFPNTDLTIHLFRQPRAEWVGFDTEVAFGPTGLGLTSTTLHDVDGPVGRAEQILTVRPIPQD
ncbi:thioesterase family protein [Mariniluteicoccus endophyticus]